MALYRAGWGTEEGKAIQKEGKASMKSPLCTCASGFGERWVRAELLLWGVEHGLRAALDYCQRPPPSPCEADQPDGQAPIQSCSENEAAQTQPLVA